MGFSYGIGIKKKWQVKGICTSRKIPFFDLSYVTKNVFCDYFLSKIVAKDTFSYLRQVEKLGFLLVVSTTKL
jgi:hypothetical protein